MASSALAWGLTIHSSGRPSVCGFQATAAARPPLNSGVRRHGKSQQHLLRAASLVPTLVAGWYFLGVWFAPDAPAWILVAALTTRLGDAAIPKTMPTLTYPHTISFLSGYLY